MIGSDEASLDTVKAFAAAMALLGPFEPAPRIAVGVSGGADSTALALLADAWARDRGGKCLALVVDHGLRVESRGEAAETAANLTGRGIAVCVLTLEGLERGPAMAERARDARSRAMTEACAKDGFLHLLLGHHAGDQAETVLIRTLGGSGPSGLAAMASLFETPTLRILRPLLVIRPWRLRALLVAAGLAWIEDPSNADPAALRPRLRMLRRDRDGGGSATAALLVASVASGQRRADEESRVAVDLSERASFHPEGFCLLSAGPIPPRALAALLQTVAGAGFPPPTEAVAALAGAPRPATLGGVQLLPAGRLGAALMMVREAAAMAPAIPARPGALWDGRFRLGRHAIIPEGASLGALGDDAARLRRVSALPAAVLRTLPVLRLDANLLAVPHLRYPDPDTCACFPVSFYPPLPAAAAPFHGPIAYGDA
jgi:tRNA(Ile)-lysidine synthase